MFRFTSFLSSICISLLFVGLLWSSAYSATFNVQDDQLIGVSDVYYDGDFYYSVEFVNSDDIQSTYDAYERIFGSHTEASAAATELMSVLYDANYLQNASWISGIEIDTQATRIFTFYEGCETEGHYSDGDDLWRPTELTIYVDGTTGYPFDAVVTLGWIREYKDTSNIGFQDVTSTFAIWTKSDTPAAVPVPTTVFLFGAGLIGLTGYGRKNRAAKQ